MAACLIIASFTLDVMLRLPDHGALLSEWIPTTYRWVDAGTRPSARYHDVRRVGVAGVS